MISRNVVRIFNIRDGKEKYKMSSAPNASLFVDLTNSMEPQKNSNIRKLQKIRIW